MERLPLARAHAHVRSLSNVLDDPLLSMSELYETVSLERSLSLPSAEFQHAAHVMIYAEWKDFLYGRYPFMYAVMVKDMTIAS